MESPSAEIRHGTLRAAPAEFEEYQVMDWTFAGTFAFVLLLAIDLMTDTTRWRY
ncbi:MAG: hypothetical protein U0935_24025 [Pirellulales bacterium]